MKALPLAVGLPRAKPWLLLRTGLVEVDVVEVRPAGSASKRHSPDPPDPDPQVSVGGVGDEGL
jgi:hypothetical protein